MKEKWDQIPSDTDILVTHGPPFGFGDMTSGRNNVGCKDLYEQVSTRIKPKFHIFGHIHEGEYIILELNYRVSNVLFKHFIYRLWYVFKW